MKLSTLTIIVLIILTILCIAQKLQAAPSYSVSTTVKMVIPWYVEISPVAPIIFIQEGGSSGRSFQGCTQLQFACNFNFYLRCVITEPLFAGTWRTWFQNPGREVYWPGGTPQLCVRVDMADLLDPDLMGKSGQQIQVAILNIYLIPR